MSLLAAPLVSVIVATRNRSEKLCMCLQALEVQSTESYEILVVDDRSTDETALLVATWPPGKIRYLSSSGPLGAGRARNVGIAHARGHLALFTDDDVEVPHDWVAQAINAFEDPDIVGIEGKLVYVSDDFKPSFSDRVVESHQPDRYMTANAGYRMSFLRAVGGFDIDLVRYQDRALGLAARKVGRVVFLDNWIAIHGRDLYTLKSFWGEAKWVQYWIILQRNLAAEDRKRVYYPARLAQLVFPICGLLRVMKYPVRSRLDLLLMFLFYPRLVLERITLWKYAVKHRYFMI